MKVTISGGATLPWKRLDPLNVRETTMKLKMTLPFVCAALTAISGAILSPAARADVSATLEVDVNKPGVTIPKTFYGLMTEEINHSYDGGLFAELVQNRTFQDPPPRGRQASPGSLPVHWAVIGAGKASIDRDDPVNAALPLSLRL